MGKINCIVMSWKDMDDFASKATSKIKESGFHPDIIIGLSRGGLVPSRMLCDSLYVKEYFSVKVDHWGVTATKDGKAKLTHKLDVDLTGKKILIVDDITDTGQSMELAKKHIEDLNATEVKTVTLIHLDHSKYTPDFYGHERSWAWIVFPWNKKEDLINLIKKIIAEEEKAVEVIRETLKSECNLDIGSEEIEETLESIRYLEQLKK